MPVNNISSNQSSLDKEYNLELIAHRGYDVNAPENSISAFDESSKAGYSTVELDVNWTEDNIPVILHDDTINRTARKENGDWLIMPRNCSDYTYVEAKKSRHYMKQ